MASKKGFDKAFEELNRIVHDLQNEESGIDQLSKKLKRARELVRQCRTSLRDIEADISAMRDEEE